MHSTQTPNREKEMIPRTLLLGMAALALSSLALVSYSVATDRAHVGVPAQAKVMVLLAWALGVLAGASSANVIAGRRAVAGRVTSGILMSLSVWTMITITHPVWFMVLAAAGAVGATVLADRTFGRPRT